MNAILSKNKTVLVLAPHTDDAELGAGGVIARLAEEGAQIHYAVFSTCEESVPHGFTRDTLAKEQLAAAASLGIPEERVRFFRFPVRNFPAHRQEILDEMIRLRDGLRPALVLAPSLRDVHQDHHTVAEEAVRAFKRTTLLGYEEAWNDLTFSAQVMIALEERHVAAKVRAVSCYASQKAREYTQEEYLQSLARCHGVRGGVPYAEVFEAIRVVL